MLSSSMRRCTGLLGVLAAGGSMAARAAAAAAVDTCPGAAFKRLPFMTQPDTSFNPLSWVSDGLNLEPIKEYAKRSLLKPGAPIAAVWVLLLVTLAFFLLWRCVRCCCVVCCQQEAFGEAHSILSGAAIRRWKALLLVACLAACGLGAWGMIKMPKQFLEGFWPAYDNVTAFGNNMAGSIDNLADMARNMSQPLNRLTGIIVTDINPTALQADLRQVGSFLDNAPCPGEFLDRINNVTAGIADLNGNLTALAALLAAGPPATPLGRLNSSLSVASGFAGLYTTMNASLGAYHQQLGALVPPQSPPANNLDPRLASLRTAQNAVNISNWVDRLDTISSALTTLRAMASGSPVSNPLLQLQGAINDVETSAGALRTAVLPAFQAAVELFNAEWVVNGSTGLTSLMQRVVYINSTVIGLPAIVVGKVDLMNRTLLSVTDLYNGTSNPVNLKTLPGMLTNTTNELALPADLASSKELLSDGGAQLQAAGADIDNLLNYVGQLKGLLVNISAPVSSVDQELETYMTTSTTYTALGNAVAVAKATLDVAVPQLSAGGGTSSNFVTTASDITSVMSGLDMPSFRSSLAGVQAQLAAVPDLSNYRGALQQLNGNYASLGTPPSQATAAISDEVDTLLSDAIRVGLDVQTQVNQVRNQIRGISTTIRDQVVGRLMRLKAQAKGYEDKYQPYAYMGLMVAYGIIMALVLLLALTAWRNCPAGLCSLGGLLNVALVLFFLLPMLYTVLLIGLRDGCANAEDLIMSTVQELTCDSNCTVPSKAQVLAQYYLKGTGGQLENVLSAGLNVDIGQLKAQVNASVNTALEEISTKLQPRQKVLDVMDDIVGVVGDMMTSLDAFLATLGYAQVNPLYAGLKGYLCCGLADILFLQWAASLGCVCACLVGLWAALVVLRKLDALAEGCCAATCYNPADYSAAPPPPGVSGPGGAYGYSEDDYSSTPMAFISLGTGALSGKGGKGSIGGKQMGKGGQQEDAYSGIRLPSYASAEMVMPVMASAASAPALGASPRMSPLLQHPALGYPGYYNTPAGPVIAGGLSPAVSLGPNTNPYAVMQMSPGGPQVDPMAGYAGRPSLTGVGAGAGAGGAHRRTNSQAPSAPPPTR